MRRCVLLNLQFAACTRYGPRLTRLEQLSAVPNSRWFCVNETKPVIDLSASALVAAFREMLRIRMVEEEIAARYIAGNDALPGALCRSARRRSRSASARARRDRPGRLDAPLSRALSRQGRQPSRRCSCELMGHKPTAAAAGAAALCTSMIEAAGVMLSLPIVAASIPVGVGAALR